MLSPPWEIHAETSASPPQAPSKLLILISPLTRAHRSRYNNLQAGIYYTVYSPNPATCPGRVNQLCVINIM